MGLLSDRNRLGGEVAHSARVADTIEIRASYRIGCGPGLVLVLDARPMADPQSFVGQLARIRVASGGTFEARIDGARDHETTISLFFGGLTAAAVPIGPDVTFPVPATTTRVKDGPSR